MAGLEGSNRTNLKDKSRSGNSNNAAFEYGGKMITRQELIEELKIKEPCRIKKELMEKLLKKWEIDGKPLECGCGKEIPDHSEHYKQIQNNLFIVACGKRRKLKMPERYDAATILKQLVPWIAWDDKAKIVVAMF